MSNYLADSSVWIAFLRDKQLEASKRLDSLLEKDDVCIADVIKAEIVSGAKTESEYNLLNEYLSSLPTLQEPADLWEQVGRAKFLLARKGLTVSISDALIAVIALSNRKTIFTLDKVFKSISKHLPLKILV